MIDKLAIAQENVAEHMDGILQSFNPGAKITVIVRRPGNNEADFLMTNDELDEASGVIARRLAALSPEPEPRGEVEVQKVETVTGAFYTDPGEPIWRIEIDGYCADFDHEQAARNFAAAINRLAALRDGEPRGKVERLREALTGLVEALGDDETEVFADEIAPALHKARAALRDGQTERTRDQAEQEIVAWLRNPLALSEAEAKAAAYFADAIERGQYKDVTRAASD